MSLHDRICNVVLTDSVGYQVGLERVLLQCANIILPPITKEWCIRKDRQMAMEDVHCKLPKVKKKRIEKVNAQIRVLIGRRFQSELWGQCA